MLDGVKPRSEPLLLRRIIMNSVGKFYNNYNNDNNDGHNRKNDENNNSTNSNNDKNNNKNDKVNFHIQLFKYGKLLSSSMVPLIENKNNTNKPSNLSSLETINQDQNNSMESRGQGRVLSGEDSVSITIDAVLQV